MSFTTETLDKAYLEYSNITSAKTAKELKLEQENKMMRECLLFIKENFLHAGVAANNCLNKITCA
jgi:hypothetical protein